MIFYLLRSTLVPGTTFVFIQQNKHILMNTMSGMLMTFLSIDIFLKTARTASILTIAADVFTLEFQ